MGVVYSGDMEPVFWRVSTHPNASSMPKVAGVPHSKVGWKFRCVKKKHGKSLHDVLVNSTSG